MKTGQKNARSDDGYTLIELVVVLIIVGVILSITFPRVLNQFFYTNLESGARRLSGSISYTQHLAVTKGISHRIYYNLEDGSYWIKEVSTTEDNVELNEGIVDKKANLPEGVIFLDITTPRGKMSNTGISYTEFLPKGTGESSAIHIASGEGKVITVEVKGYMVRPRLKDGYSE